MAGTNPEIVIVGAGPAGLRAAQIAVEAGLRPTLIDEAPRVGGQIYRQPPSFPGFVRPLRELYGVGERRAAALFRDFERIRPSLDYRPGWLAYDLVDHWIHATDGQQSKAILWDALILATGATDRIIPCPGWTTPGVFGLGGAQIALKFQGCAIGHRAIFVGTGPLLFLTAYQYAKAGAPPAAILVPTPRGPLWRALPSLLGMPLAMQRGLRWIASLRRMGVPILFGHRLIRILGGAHVTAVDATEPGGRARRFECDAVALGYGLESETQLADLAGARFLFDAGQRQHLPEMDAMGRAAGVPGLYLAGDGAGILGADAAEARGRLAALAALEDLKLPFDSDTRVADLRIVARWASFQAAMRQAFPYPANLAAKLADNVVICRCELVRAGDLREAAGIMGATDINRVKALTRLGMGRCQGRLCGLVAAEILAAKLGLEPAAIGRLRGQPPLKPVAAGALRAGNAQ